MCVGSSQSFSIEKGERRERRRGKQISKFITPISLPLCLLPRNPSFSGPVFFAANSAYNVHRIMASAAAGEGASKCLRLSSLLFYPHSTNFLTNSPEWQFHPRNHNRTASSKIEGSKSDSVNAISCHLSVAVLTVCSALLQAVATSWAS